MRRGFLYLVAIMDWASRKVLAWRLSNTMDADFCVEALREAILKYGCPDIFNTDQGSQFTSLGFVGILTDAGIRVSMDGKPTQGRKTWEGGARRRDTSGRGFGENLRRQPPTSLRHN